MAAGAGAARAVQGVGAGGLIALSLAVIADIAGPRQRAKYQGYVLAVLGMSTVLGPVLGGFFAGVPVVAGVAGWRWIFYLNMPIAAASMTVLTRHLRVLHRRQDHRWPMLEHPGHVAAAALTRFARQRDALANCDPSDGVGRRSPEPS